ncbi:MAG: hypothetical protein EAS52_18525 [Parapedobacter sp.]|nr:MAG: hypothetical protein EAS52_18525 [Parapedobacter sp.]
MCQITTRAVPPRNKIAEIASYDSTTNFQFQNVGNYVGQRLYLKGKSEGLRKFGYRDMYNSIGDGSHTYLMKVENTYKPLEESEFKLGGYSSYDQLAGRYFKVDSVIKNKFPSSVNPFFLKLIEEESGDTAYFALSTEYESSFPFIIVGYFEKIKAQNVGKKFVLRENFVDGVLDINTSNPVTYNYLDAWECKDVTIDEQYFRIKLVLSNGHNEIFYDIEALSNSFSDVVAGQYRKKFGATNWKKILEGVVSLGMTKEMCEISWGVPNDINKTITSGVTHEQWVYDDNYLYFDNGILKAIQ